VTRSSPTHMPRWAPIASSTWPVLWGIPGATAGDPRDSRRSPSRIDTAGRWE
jgi:hypothetical protein